MTEGDETAQISDDIRNELDAAIRDILARHKFMATTWSSQIEVMDLDDNKTYIWSLRADGQTAWMTLGMLEFHKRAVLKAIE